MGGFREGLKEVWLIRRIIWANSKEDELDSSSEVVSGQPTSKLKPEVKN